MAGGYVDSEGQRDRLATALVAGEHIVLQGPAGIGKTRLARELVETNLSESRRVDRLLASESTKDHQFAVLAPLGSPTGVMPGDVPGLMSWYFAQWRTAARSGQPPLVWIDDAQHLDGLTASLLRQAVSSNVVQILATHRSSEPLPVEMVAMTTEGSLTTQVVAPLTQKAARHLVNAASTGDIDAERVARIIELANGNPLFVLELTSAARTGDSIRDNSSLSSVIGHRFTALTPELRATVELVALTEPIEPALLPHRQSEIAELQSKGLVITHGSRLRLDHPLHAAWLIENIGNDHDHFAELLANAPRDTPSPTRLSWTLRANTTPEPDLALDAARELLMLSDGPGLLKLVDFLPDDQRDLIQAKALMLIGQLDDGLALLDQVRNTGSPEERVDAASWMARYLGVMLGQYETAHQVLAEVDHPGLAVPLRRTLLHARQWLWIYGPGGADEFIDLALELIEPHQPVDHSSYDVAIGATALATHERGAHLCPPIVERALWLEGEVEVEREAYFRAIATRGGVELFSGRPLAAARLEEKAMQEALKCGSAEGVALLGSNACYAFALGGMLQTAIKYGEISRSYTIALDPFRLGVLGNWMLVGALTLSNEATKATQVVESLGDFNEGAGTLEIVFACRSLTLLEQAMDRAVSYGRVHNVLQLCAANNKWSWSTSMALEIVDSSSPAEIHALIAEQLSRFGPEVPVQGVTRKAALARLDQNPIDLLDCARQTEAFPVGSTRAAADAIRFAPDDDAIRHQATRLIVQAQLRWDGGPMWWLKDIEGLPTSRQIDIAAQVASGMEVRAIAEKLHVSKRTVENHLYRFTRAVGMQGTNDLAMLFAPIE